MHGSAGEEQGERALDFFGDSFMFGEGMPDEATMPYQVWKKLKGGTYRTVNFGCLGYEPRQMLASVQEGRLTSQGHCRPSHVWYQALPAYVSRAAGLESWDHHGPRYVLDAERRMRRDCHFDDDREVVEAVQRVLARQGVSVLAVSAILPNVPAARALCEISPYDRHPNALAHEIISDFVAQRLFQQTR